MGGAVGGPCVRGKGRKKKGNSKKKKKKECLCVLVDVAVNMQAVLPLACSAGGSGSLTFGGVWGGEGGGRVCCGMGVFGWWCWGKEGMPHELFVGELKEIRGRNR